MIMDIHIKTKFFFLILIINVFRTGSIIELEKLLSHSLMDKPKVEPWCQRDIININLYIIKIKKITIN